ncbi:MAG: AraC family transcriptional regulator [Elusimicrobia bacterium]|nr:AraC family transcriptional regulator [Elusimicrobiota bacterium]
MKLDYSLKEKKTNKLIYVGCIDPYPDRKIQKHYHPFHEMVVLIKGSICVKISKKDIHASPGDVLLYPAGLNHRERLTSTTPAEIIVFAWKEKRKLEVPILTHDISKRIRLLAKWAYEERKTSSPYKSILQGKIFEVILAELIKNSKSKEPHTIIDKVRSFMKEHLKEHLTLENLAKHAGMSKYHFLKKYKKLTGQTPMDDLRIIRVETAKDMIFSTDLSLKTISKGVGFANEHHLSRIFRNHFGTPPGQFRKKASYL